jgi:hypothetical protein
LGGEGIKGCHSSSCKALGIVAIFVKSKEIEAVKALGERGKKILDIKYHIVVPRPVTHSTKGGDVVEMDMQDSADMCSCATKLDKLLRKRRRKGRADLRRL